MNDIAWRSAFSTPHTHLIHWHWHLTGIHSHESGRLWLLHRRRGSISILCSHLHCGWPFPHVCSIWDRRSVIRYCEIQETPLRRRYYLSCVTPDANIPSALSVVTIYRPLGPTSVITAEQASQLHRLATTMTFAFATELPPTRMRSSQHHLAS